MRKIRLQRVRARSETTKKFREHEFTEVANARYSPQTREEAVDEQLRTGKIKSESVPIQVREPWWRRLVRNIKEAW